MFDNTRIQSEEEEDDDDDDETCNAKSKKFTADRRNESCPIGKSESIESIESIYFIQK